MTLKNNLETKQVEHFIPIINLQSVVGSRKTETAEYISNLPRCTFQQYGLDPCHQGQLLLEGHEQRSCLYQIFDYQL
jgi:hypothetical protein